MSNRLKVLIADDHDLMVAALRRVLAVRDDFEIVGQAKTGDDVLPLVLETRPDVVLLDIGMPGIDGIECARRIRSRRPEVRILILTAHGDVASVEAAERAGADGFIVKSIGAPDLVELLASPTEGYFLAGLPEHSDAARLTSRERVVLRALAEGLTNREIGRELWISEDTVKFHLKNLYRKLGASDRAELALRARDPGIAWSSLRQMRTA